MSVSRDIALRYLRFSSTSRSVFAMAIISVVGIAIGVATLIVTISVASGFGEAYRRTITDFGAHVALLSVGEIEDAEEVTRRLGRFSEGLETKIRTINPFVYREALIIYKGQIRGIVIKGVDIDRLKESGGIALNIGSFDHSESGEVLDNMLVLGSYLASELGVKSGDKVRLMLPEHLSGSAQGVFEELLVTGTFESGMYDFDAQFALMPISRAQSLFNLHDTVSGIEIKLADWRQSKSLAKRLGEEFQYPLYATDWQELNRSLFEAVKLEKLMFAIIMGALVVVASFNIVATVMLRVFYKTRDMSILRALGMTRSNVKKIFVIHGIAVGGLGIVLGVFGALILMLSVKEFLWVKIPYDIYLISTLPVCISLPTIVVISAFGLVVCSLTSIVASRRAVGIPIIKGLHWS